jgi:hypothetical protein
MKKDLKQTLLDLPEYMQEPGSPVKFYGERIWIIPLDESIDPEPDSGLNSVASFYIVLFCKHTHTQHSEYIKFPARHDLIKFTGKFMMDFQVGVGFPCFYGALFEVDITYMGAEITVVGKD